MTWQTDSVDVNDTELLGEKLGALLKGGEVIDLRADLGGGKTTFVRGIAKGMGSKNSVTSPSFTLQKIYNSGDSDLSIHHYDFYRLGNEPGIVADQLAESLSDPQVIVVVEWSDSVEDVLPKERISIEFKPNQQNFNQRQITFSYPESLSPLIKELENKSVEVEP